MMLDQEALTAFYKSHSLEPKPNHNFHLPNATYLNIILDAKDQYGKSFSMFVVVSLAPIDDNTYTLGFEEWKELHDCYCAYMTGLAGNKS